MPVMISKSAHKPTPGGRRRRSSGAFRVASASVAAVAVGLGTVAVIAAAPAGATRGGSQPAQPDSDRFVASPIVWGPCDPDDFFTDAATGQSLVPPTYQCASYEVPLDYDAPDGERVTLALVKRPADNPAAPAGTLFWNPGGPGGGASEITAYFGETLFTPGVRANYDIVGVDPRGIARSTPLQCYESNDDFFAARAADEFQGIWPDTRQEWGAQRRDARNLEDDCERIAGPIIDHMSTANVARDFDVLRRAVGDEDFSFVGYSYGTFVCAAYANLFPERVGSLVCDGNLDPVEWTTGERGEGSRISVASRVGSGLSSEETLTEFFRLCEEAGPELCAFAPQAAARYDALYDALAAEPLVLGTTTLDEQLLAEITRRELYNSFAWPVFAATLAQFEALAAGQPPAGPPGPPPAPGVVPPVNEFYLNAEGGSGVLCTDGRQPNGMAAWERAVRRAPEYLSPVWANLDSDCAYWPGRDRDRYLGPFTAETAATVLIVNPRFDPATPYDDGVAHRDLLPNSALLTVEGWGHTSLGMSICADAIIEDYLLTGQLPGAELTCTQEFGPFGVPAQTPPLAAAPATAQEATGAFGAPLPVGEPAEALTEEVVTEAAETAVAVLAETGDAAEASSAAADVVADAVEQTGDPAAADRLRARTAVLDQISEAGLG